MIFFQIYCSKCGQDWGVTVKIDRFLWPCIKTEGFAITLKDSENRRPCPRSWKKFPCAIAEISSEEMEQAFQSLEIT